jgi:biotin synthase-like enzyme
MAQNLIQKANKILSENFSKDCYFERAIFLTWYCSKGDCKFCWMSTQKKKIKNPRFARRRIESILTETLICKICNWKIEFLSGGYDCFTFQEIIDLIKNIKLLYDDKLWLNIGILNEQELIKLRPYIYGVTGAVETIDKKLHKQLCPSKPIQEIKDMFKVCDKLNLKKAITIIIGLGEKLNDFKKLKIFIKKYKLKRITFYALNPHKGTMFDRGPESKYYAKWIAKTRIDFPKIEIIAGSWHTRLDEISLLLKAGANNITKFKSIKLFNTKYSKYIVKQVKSAKRDFKGNLVNFPKVDLNKELRFFKKELRLKIIKRFKDYHKNFLKK